LMGALGVISSYVTYSFMIQSVNKELARGVDMFMRPPRGQPPPFDRGPKPPDGEGPRDFRGAGPPDGPDHGGPGHHERGGGPRRPPNANHPYPPHVFTADGKAAFPDEKRAVWDPAALALALKGETHYTNVVVDDEPLRVLS